MQMNILLDSFYQTDFSELKLPMITVYYDALDFPKKYSARVFDSLAEAPCGMDFSHRDNVKVCNKCKFKHIGAFVPAATNHVVVKDTLEEIQKAIPGFFTRMMRSPEDEVQIMEVWI